MGFVSAFILLIRASFLDRSRLALENMALRQQLAVYYRSIARFVIRKQDRIFWALLSRMWTGWRNSLILVKPQTVIRWHSTDSASDFTGDGSAAGPNRNGHTSGLGSCF